MNSDSEFHNTKSKQVTAESVTGIYMEKLHYHVSWRMCLLFCLGRNTEIQKAIQPSLGNQTQKLNVLLILTLNLHIRHEFVLL